MKDPKKISSLMKSVGSKLESKMKSGEISKEELVKEAGDLLSKMKDMGGGKEFNDMFKKIAKNMYLCIQISCEPEELWKICLGILNVQPFVYRKV